MSGHHRRSYFDVINDLELNNFNWADSINSDALYSSLRCTGVLGGHTGCVNALDWSGDGQMLASGSDDRNLCLWSFPNRTLRTTLPTGHTQNIFSVAYLPTTDDKIITVAGDALVKFVQVKDDGRAMVVRTWNNHHDRVKRITTEPLNPQIFMTASEDGTVREFDLRVPEQGNNCLADWSNEGISLNSLSLSPLRPFLIAAAGTGPVIRFIDRRKPEETTKERGLVWMPVQRNLDMVTAVQFSSHSMDLIASLINDHIHLLNFDTFQTTPATYSNFVEREALAHEELARKWSRGDYEDYFYALSQLITRHRSLQYSLIGDLSEVLACEIYNRMLCAVKIDQLEQAEADAFFLVEGGTLDPRLLRLAYLILYMQSTEAEDEDRKERFKSFLEAIHFGDAPSPDVVNTHDIIDPTTLEAWTRLKEQRQVCTHSQQIFKGHVNSHTVKDVCFVGSHDEYIASGSDGGYFFIWNRQEERPLFIGASDSQVVNVIAENPRMPVFAIGGIDNDIKIWDPSAEDTPVEWRAIPREQHSAFLERLRRIASDGMPILTVPCPVQ
ncbi:hypothetical protein PSACC_00678 [Paramicrosporidium saccamoebae]|uniref:WD40 repeat-like protein n=1 Tax=Paramicrosporidium saccamoebae TaxID=1246581 RepID=A0A2H9TP22_9FUNG|nr:hypothetical protein PSACC_00678 [Paramicrosporidium saccamoebae]